jgi:hypothetical protein
LWNAATRCGTAAATGIAMLLAAACATRPVGPRIATSPAPSDVERYCAWYGDRRDDVLYFGESPFWNALRDANGDAMADLRVPGPRVVGRFDLGKEALLTPLTVDATEGRAAIWDVLAHPNGRVYFTTFYEEAGAIDLATGATDEFTEAGTGLNELALGPNGRVVASRYGAAGGGAGTVVVLAPDGRIESEWPLDAGPGLIAAAKSVAYDPERRVVWVNTDIVGGAEDNAHDARVFDFATGRPLLRVASPELQFPQFARDGRGFFAWRDGAQLVLRMTEPGTAEGPESGRAIMLDDAFPAGNDFVQEVRVEDDGRAVVTRWSGVVHVVDPSGAVRRVALPRPVENGLFYTATVHGDRVCATYCADVSVVCADLE